MMEKLMQFNRKMVIHLFVHNYLNLTLILLTKLNINIKILAI